MSGGPSPGDRSLLDLRVADLLDRVAERSPAPGGGSVAALSLALAAGLTAMSARFSPDLPDGPAVAAAAERHRRTAEGLADRDATAYAGYLAALRLPDDDPGRPAAVAAALDAATEVPLAVAVTAAEVAGLAARVAASGNPRLRGDALAGALLAAAAAETAAALARENAAT